MDLSRLDELRNELLEAVQDRVKVLCQYSKNRDLVEEHRLMVGHSTVVFTVWPTVEGKHAILLTAGQARKKRFSENAHGWFPTVKIAQHIVEVLGREEKQRQESARQYQLYQSAVNDISRLSRTLPEGVSLTPSSRVPGGMDITIAGLTEAGVQGLLDALAKLRKAPVPEDDGGLWNALHND